MDFTLALKSWLERCQSMIDDHRAKNFPNLEREILTIDPRGKKYIRIVQEMSNGQRTVFCFIDKSTGNVLFPAGWKAPTTHNPVRGNIWTIGEEGVTVYGAKYINK